MNNFENPPAQEKQELFYPQVEYGREPAMEIFNELLNQEEKSKEILDLLELTHGENDKDEDEEVLNWLAMTFNHPEREEDVFSRIKEHKSHIKDAKLIQEKIFEILSKYNIQKSSIAGDKESESITSEYSERIKNLIEYFKPIDLQSKVHRVIKVDADKIVKEESGYCIKIDKDAYIFSPSDNKDNFDHEFMHTFINPIVDKLSEQLTNFEKQKLKEIVHPDLKKDYGDHFESLMCESIIRVYNDFFKRDAEKYVGGFKDFELGNKIYYLFQQYTKQELEKAVDFETFLLNNKDILLN